MTTMTIPASELLEGDTIRDDDASKRHGTPLELEALVVVVTAPSRMISVYGTSRGIERQILYGPDELVTVARPDGLRRRSLGRYSTSARS